jgi:AAA15 family ATPase/GTPase
MNEHFIKNIEIKNFKCFKDFKAEGFGRVNLIGGKNNVGKTAFMEACYINTQKTSFAIARIIFMRHQINLLKELLKEVGQKYIYNFIKEKSKEIEGGEVISNLSTSNIEYIEEEKNKALTDIIFLDTIRQDDNKLDTWYARIIENSLENKVDNIIQDFDNQITKFRIIKSQPMSSKKDDGIFYNLNEFGDGLAKFISYILVFLSQKDAIVFIDEIENGIHYTNLDKLWEIILTVSKEQNVQVFATTHSKECIESYARVAKKLGDEEITFIELGKNKKNEIKAITMDYERFQDEIDNTNEVRGW